MRSVPFYIWVLIIGGTGLAAGFFGPLILSPETNQGPLVGILITGPGGALLGLLFWAISRIFGYSGAGQWKFIGIVSILLGTVTLFFVMPEPALRGTAVELQVVDCVTTPRYTRAALAFWDKRTTEVTWAPPRPGWREELQNALQSDTGVVMDALILRKNELYENRTPWKRGEIAAKGWTPSKEKKSYYARFDGFCAEFPIGKRGVYYSAYEISSISPGAKVDWPPKDLPALLDRPILERVPDTFKKLIGK